MELDAEPRHVLELAMEIGLHQRPSFQPALGNRERELVAIGFEVKARNFAVFVRAMQQYRQTQQRGTAARGSEQTIGHSIERRFGNAAAMGSDQRGQIAL